MKKIVIGKNDSGQRIDKFLTKYLKRLPNNLMYKYIRKKRVKVNNKKCDISYILKERDILNLYINDEFFPENTPDLDFLSAPSKLNVVYEDRNILIVDKKPGLIVHPDRNVEIDCLINRIKHYLYAKREYNPHESNTFSPALANRIDHNTGGIVIAAKNAESLRILNDKIKNKEIKKYYLCKVQGIMNKKSDTLISYLLKDPELNKVRISSSKKDGYKQIITKYTVKSHSNNESLLEIDLVTGKAHQIRAHMSFIGHPILGDRKYGLKAYNKQKNYPYQALYSYKIHFDFSQLGTPLDYLNGKTFQVNKIWFLENK